MAARRVEIVGAGIAGLTAAAAFARRGWAATVHERSDSLRAVGSGIYIWDNGMRVLRAIGAYEQAVAGSHWGRIRETRNQKDQVTAVHRFPVEGDGRVVAVVRQQLMDALAQAATAAGARIELSSRVEAVDAAGAITVNGARREAELVVLADGVGSRLRDSLGIACRRTVLGDGAIRVMIPRLDTERQEGTGRLGDDGGRAADGFKFIEYWSGRRRVLYTPCNAAWVYLALTCPNDDPAHAVPFDAAPWKASFPHLAGLFDRINGPGASEPHWGRFETVELARWSAGRVAVVGDAAYAQAPNLGQGGGCAMMGALALAHFASGGADLERALRDWEASERPLYQHTQRFSSFISRSTWWPDWARSAFFAVAGRSAKFNEMRWRAARHLPIGS